MFITPHLIRLQQHIGILGSEHNQCLNLIVDLMETGTEFAVRNERITSPILLWLYFPYFHNIIL